MDTVIKLIAQEQTQDTYGVWQSTKTEREVFAQVHSIRRSEFYNAGRNGLNPAFEFTVFQGDYNGEVLCAYDGMQYAIYRTYIVPGTDYIELYVQREGGTNAEEN